MIQFTYQITDALGIHARPAGQLVKQAKAFSSVVKIKKGEKEADMKGLMGLMTLSVKQGEIVTVSVEGPDEEQAAKELEAFMKENL